MQQTTKLKVTVLYINGCTETFLYEEVTEDIVGNYAYILSYEPFEAKVINKNAFVCIDVETVPLQ